MQEMEGVQNEEIQEKKEQMLKVLQEFKQNKSNEENKEDKEHNWKSPADVVSDIVKGFRVLDEEEYKKIEKELKKAEERKLKTEEEMQRERWTIEDKKTKIKERLENIENRLNEVLEEVEGLKSEMQEVKSMLTTKFAEIDELKREMQEMKSILTEIVARLDKIDKNRQKETKIDKSSQELDKVGNGKKSIYLIAFNEYLNEIDGKDLQFLGRYSRFWKTYKQMLIEEGLVELKKDGRKRIVVVDWSKLDKVVKSSQKSSKIDKNRQKETKGDKNRQEGCIEEPLKNQGVANVENVDNEPSTSQPCLNNFHYDSNENYSFILNTKREDINLKDIRQEKESLQQVNNSNKSYKAISESYKPVREEKREKVEILGFDSLATDEVSVFESEVAELRLRKVVWKEILKGEYFRNGETYKVPERVLNICRRIEEIAKSKKRNKRDLIEREISKDYLKVLIDFDYIHPDTYLPLYYERVKEIKMKHFVPDELYETAKTKWKTITREHIAGLWKIARSKGLDKNKLESLIASTSADYTKFKNTIKNLDTRFLPKIVSVKITNEPFESYLLKGYSAPDRKRKEGEDYFAYVDRLMREKEELQQLQKFKEIERQAPAEWIRKLKDLKAVDFRSVIDHLYETVSKTRKLKRLIIFAGRSGIGKTFSAFQLALLLAKTKPFIGFIEHPKITNKKLKEFIQSNSYGIILLDDLGFGGQRKIADIIFTLHSSRKDPTIITMNLEPIDILINYGEAVMRRLHESSVWLRVEGLETVLQRENFKLEIENEI